jgi:hypothetical protein
LRRGFTILAADPIESIAIDIHHIVMMSFLKCLALLNRVPAGKFNGAGRRRSSFLGVTAWGSGLD